MANGTAHPVPGISTSASFTIYPNTTCGSVGVYFGPPQPPRPVLEARHHIYEDGEWIKCPYCGVSQKPKDDIALCRQCGGALPVEAA